MKAIAVYPGKPHSMHLEDVPMPKITDIPNGQGVLVKVLRVGVDGTDKEINAAEYGMAPECEKFLITGHENFGRVVEVGPYVPDTIKPGTYVVATVRRPGHSIYDSIGLQDMTTDDMYYERGINLSHGYLTEYYVEDAAYIVTLPSTLREVGVLLEPLTVAEKGLNQAYEMQRRLKVWQPRRAVVVGAGTIGLLATLAMRLRGMEVTCYLVDCLRTLTAISSPNLALITSARNRRHSPERVKYMALSTSSLKPPALARWPFRPWRPLAKTVSSCSRASQGERRKSR
jgi:threonine dehydrogenase-like Zn-dependent dehydrogenase